MDSFDNVPKEMIKFELEGGTYAVFHFKGRIKDPAIFQYIFNFWLPSSEYQLDHRPHFEILGENFKKNNMESEEEICIPIKDKK
jgi:AraC family transcriptional regulator